MILAIDPGTTHSGWVAYYPEREHLPEIVDRHHCQLRVAIGDSETANARLINDVRPLADFNAIDCAVIEDVRCYGQPVGYETFETCIWIGRFTERLECEGIRVVRLARLEVKKHLCGRAACKDKDVNDALWRRFGPGRTRAVGTAKAPGPLYGISGHAWSALALAVTFADTTALAAEKVHHG